MQPPLIRVEKLSKSYSLEHGRVDALKPVDLQIEAGQCVAIMGPSGSGKSTLLHLLGCLDTPSCGHYFLNQQEISLLSDLELSQLRSSKIGFVFQSYNLIPQLTVYENIEVPFLYQSEGLSKEEIEQRIAQALKQVKLQHRLHHLPSQLSGGEAQRVAIARAVAISPLMILADEPTGNLDRATGHQILELFEEVHASGATIIIVTHDESIGKRCQRTIQMLDGSLRC